MIGTEGGGLKNPQIKSELLNDQLEILINHINKYNEVETVILFGSSARNTNSAASDIDVLILVNDDSVDIENLTSNIRKDTFFMLSLPIDILVETRATFEIRKKLPTLERIIDREGVILYAA